MERPSRLRQQPPGESESRTGAGLRLQRPDCPLLPRSVPTPQSTRDSGVPAPSVHRRKLWSGAGSQVQPGSQPLLFLPHPESLEGKKRWAQTGKGRWGSRQGGLEVMGPDAMILVFLVLSFKLIFSLSSFTLIKRFFSSSSFSAIRVVSSTYLRLLIVLLAILIPACDSSSPAFHLMYSAEKLNKQSDNIQPCHTPFLIFNQSVVPCLILTIASCFAYRFLRRQVRWSGISTRP